MPYILPNFPILEPRGTCTCGHSGDGPGSQHFGPQGLGPCIIRNCSCDKYELGHEQPKAVNPKTKRS